MANGKATASFFENGTTAQFEYCFKMYPQVLKLKAEKRCKKPQELIRLDQWYQNELPKLIKARGKDAHMVYDELVQTMKWKQSRGKFYPQLSYLVKVNTPRAVMQETKKAFRKLPNLEQAITALSNLKGVGTTMASALLAAAAPDSAPFMADECLMAIPEIEGIDYTTKEYLNFVQHIQSTVERLNIEVGGETPKWSPHRVELALWAHYVANDLNPELLDEMPTPGVGGGALNTNGSIKNADDDIDGDGDGIVSVGSKVLDGEDDTNDGDDESCDAAGRRNNANESENENTNPAPLGKSSSGVVNVAGHGVDVVGVGSAVVVNASSGDSNFISNDSTSQEQIIDENTTQTTTTTSTDDGEAIGTPLASDSESNIEAPLKANHHHNANTNASANAVVANTAAADVVTPAKVVPPSQPQSQTQTPTVVCSSSSSSNSNIKVYNNGLVEVVEGTTQMAPAAGATNNAANSLSPLAAAIGNGKGNGSMSIVNSENSNCVLAKRVSSQLNENDDDDEDDDEADDDDDEDVDEDVDDDDEDDDDDEEDEEVIDDESNSNSGGRIESVVLESSKTKATSGSGSGSVKNDTSSAISSSDGNGDGGVGAGNLTSPTIGQKRTVMHCAAADAGGDGAGVGVDGNGSEANSEPDSKKQRTE